MQTNEVIWGGGVVKLPYLKHQNHLKDPYIVWSLGPNSFKYESLDAEQEAGEEPRMAGPIAGTTHRCRWSQARRMLRQAVPPPPCSCMFVLQMVTAQIKICVSDPRISFVPRPYRQSTGVHATKLARGLLVYSHSTARQTSKDKR